VVFAAGESFAGNELTRFFLTNVTKLPSEEFSSITCDDTEKSYSELWHQGYNTAHTIALYEFAGVLFAVADAARKEETTGKTKA
jgi:hypothetical protein